MTVIDISTGALIDESGSTPEPAHREKSVLDITAPDGRCIFSIRKLVEEDEDKAGNG